MTQIEEYSCNTNRELEMREEYWRRELQAQLNSYAAFVENKYQRSLELNPNLNQTKYQRQLELHPNYNQAKYKKELEMHSNLNQTKYQRTLELNPNYHKERYQKGKQMQQEYKIQLRKTEYVCECGYVTNEQNKNRHFKTKSHLAWLEQKA